MWNSDFYCEILFSELCRTTDTFKTGDSVYINWEIVHANIVSYFVYIYIVVSFECYVSTNVLGPIEPVSIWTECYDIPLCCVVCQICRELEVSEGCLDQLSLSNNTTHISHFKLHQRALHVYQGLCMPCHILNCSCLTITLLFWHTEALLLWWFMYWVSLLSILLQGKGKVIPVLN
jgi:hypothetical protein